MKDNKHYEEGAVAKSLRNMDNLNYVAGSFMIPGIIGTVGTQAIFDTLHTRDLKKQNPKLKDKKFLEFHGKRLPISIGVGAALGLTNAARSFGKMYNAAPLQTKKERNLTKDEKETLLNLSKEKDLLGYIGRGYSYGMMTPLALGALKYDMRFGSEKAQARYTKYMNSRNIALGALGGALAGGVGRTLYRKYVDKD